VSTRRDALRALLPAAGVDALLVTDLVNVRYLTGFTGSNAALLVHVDGDARSRLCTDGRYRVQAATEVPDLEVVIDRACAVALAGLAPGLGIGKLGFESDHVTVDAHAALAEGAEEKAALLRAPGLVQQLRMIKDPAELATLRTACAIADAALAELVDHGGLAAGRTEVEVALDLENRMRVLGAAADWQREVYALVAEAQAAGRAALTPGADVSDVDAAARRVVVDAGRGEQFLHPLGHGVGLQIHEAPLLGATGSGRLAAGMAITVEPGVYLEGRGGVRIEDTLVVTDAAPEVLTRFPKELAEV